MKKSKYDVGTLWHCHDKLGHAFFFIIKGPGEKKNYLRCAIGSYDSSYRAVGIEQDYPKTHLRKYASLTIDGAFEKYREREGKKWVKEVMKSRKKPVYATNEEAERETRRQLEDLAGRKGKSVYAYFLECESNPEFDEEQQEFHRLYCLWGSFRKLIDQNKNKLFDGFAQKNPPRKTDLKKLRDELGKK